MISIVIDKILLSYCALSGANLPKDAYVNWVDLGNAPFTKSCKTRPRYRKDEPLNFGVLNIPASKFKVLNLSRPSASAGAVFSSGPSALLAASASSHLFTKPRERLGRPRSVRRPLTTANPNLAILKPHPNALVENHNIFAHLT